MVAVETTTPDPSGCDQDRLVLILTAPVAGGHVASARAVRDAVERAGQRAVILDGLEVMSRRLEWFLVNYYGWQIKNCPWSYGIGYRVLAFRPLAALVRFLIGLFWGDNLLAAIAATQADVVVSTYPVVTAGLGRLIAAGRLDLPVAATVTDFGAHPLWVSPQIDLHLVPSRRTRELVERAGGRGHVMVFPVGDRFAALPSRERARVALDLPADAVIPLIVGGSWGVGNIEGTTATAVAAGTYPVVVTAENTTLRARLEKRFPDPKTARILGWTDQLPLLMAAADCLIQNAGGVTCLEAISIGLPILFVEPIPGHGHDNARIMAEVGAASPTLKLKDLETTLRRVVMGAAFFTPPARDPGCAAAPAVLEMRRAPSHGPGPMPRRGYRHPFLAAAFLALLVWIAFSPGIVDLAAAHTALLVDASGVPPNRIAFGVRTGDPETAQALQAIIDREHLPVTLFLEEGAIPGVAPGESVTLGLAATAAERRDAGAVDEWRRLHRDAAVLEAQAGVRPVYILPPGHRSTLVDLATMPRHTRLILHYKEATGPLAPGLLMLDTTGLAPNNAVAMVERWLTEARAGGWQVVPLERLP